LNETEIAEALGISLATLHRDWKVARVYPDGTPSLFKTTDGGATWSAINSGLAGIIGTRTPITALVLDPKLSILYLGNSGGGVFKSIDGGANWTPFNDGLLSLDIRALAVSSDGSGTVCEGTPGGSSEKWTTNEDCGASSHRVPGESAADDTAYGRDRRGGLGRQHRYDFPLSGKSRSMIRERGPRRGPR
jgi:photosystem II stability/assembly factor-like uncharacterized protein